MRSTFKLMNFPVYNGTFFFQASLMIRILRQIHCLAGHVLRILDLFYMTHHSFPAMPGKSRAYFEAINLLPKHVGAVLINGRCIGYIWPKIAERMASGSVLLSYRLFKFEFQSNGYR